MFEEYKPLIEDAGQNVYTVAKRTALDRMNQLSDQQNNHIWLKREDQQEIFSYKIRGAYNILRLLPKEKQAAGIIAASAGNHAQGVALAANHLGIAAHIVMPKTTPDIKINSVRRLRAEIILYGNTYDDAKDHAMKIAADEGFTFISPYDHQLIIAGQATVGIEIIEQYADQLDMIFVPVGGGGLIAGVALYVKECHSDVKIIGVEADEAPCMYEAMNAGEPVLLDNIGIFADGAAIKQAGYETFRVSKELVDEVILVNMDDICAAIKDIFEDTRTIAEPAGALGVAGLKKYIAREQIKDKAMVAIFTGANVNFSRLRHIAELAELGSQREALIGITILEEQGSFIKFCHALGGHLITEFNYRYSDPKIANLFVGVQLREGITEKDSIMQNLIDKGYQVDDLSDNEVAKMHIRYMIGGHPTKIENEIIYRFEFPERVGALLRFLNELDNRWNISLFHYRNHGSAYGRVLMGLQVPPDERDEFEQSLGKLNIQYWDESNNPAYDMFLGELP